MYSQILKSTGSYGNYVIHISPTESKHFWKKKDAVDYLEGKAPKTLIGSSPTIEGLQKIVNDFYYSSCWIIQDGKAYNTKLQKEAGEVITKKGRFYFYL